ncbi:hypothetical protein RF11_00720 [Thelohanellus kitauei]|uniref:Uncharacterized protein n=1 Tax=Thelohanellus kitauei TaxID=669202 RepID=A0A0C2NKY7_THEKT|nr:hypothetical protein RF11_00720 [Thelohanellus kitauei]
MTPPLLCQSITAFPSVEKSNKKTCFVSRQNPTTSHCPSITRPRLNFRLPNFASSISTVRPGPPIFPPDASITASMQTYLINVIQSQMVLDDNKLLSFLILQSNVRDS